jgi:uncharacterized protein (TIGR02145 family)
MNNPVSGAEIITISKPVTQNDILVYTNDSGTAIANNCIAGSYRLQVSMIDYNSLTYLLPVSDNTTSNVQIIKNYGCLYNQYAVNTDKLAPSGWHVPSKDEYLTLINYMGCMSVAGQSLRSSSKKWTNCYQYNNNVSGFSALPGGRRVVTISSTFVDKNNVGVFLTTSHDNNNYYYSLWVYGDQQGTLSLPVWSNASGIKNGYSTRFIKDDAIWMPGDTLTDEDGNIYNTIKIGGQVWTVDNFRGTKLNDGTSIDYITGATDWAQATVPAYCYYNNDIDNA